MKNPRRKTKNQKQLAKRSSVAVLKKWITKNRITLIIFFIYLVITLVAVLFHENWEDEAQAWLTARDCSPIELFSRMSTEGHFTPWYLILMPFAKLGFPYRTMNIISWLITASSVWLMLKYLPCRFYKRVILVFTFPMIYLYPAISRCYCLLPLGTILSIMFYKDRFKKPLRYLFSILIIANVHTYTFGFAFVIGMEFLVDWIRQRKTFTKQQNCLIMYGIAGTVVLTVLSCLPLIESVGASSQAASGLKILLYQNPLKELFVYTPILFFQWFIGPLPTLAYIAASFLIVWEYFTRRKEFLKIAFAIVWQWVICCFVFTMISPQRVVIVIFIILFFVSCRNWRPKEEDVFSKSAWNVTNILANLLFIAFAVWLEIDTGNMNLAFLALFAILIFTLAVFLHKKRMNAKERARKIGQIIAKIALAFLALLNVWIGVDWVKNEIDKPYSDALATAEFINKNLGDDSVFLTVQESSMPFTAIMPNLRSRQNRFYSIRRHDFYTFTIYLTPNGTNFPVKNVSWSNYCRFGNKLYYVDLSEQYYDDDDIFDSGNLTTPTTYLENDGLLTKVFDAYEGYSPTEHYAIYEINPDVCMDVDDH